MKANKMLLILVFPEFVTAISGLLMGTCLIFSTSAFAGENQEPIGDDVHALPLFDAHMHYKQEAWKAFPAGTVLSLMDESGVAMALVSSTPDEGTIRLWDYAPARIVPELRPYHGEYGSRNWTRAPDMLTYLKKRMEAYPHVGIGEFHLHQLDAKDTPLLKGVLALAREKGAIIHIHSAAGQVKRLFELESDITVIWAHAGLSEPPAVIGPMLAAYPRLYADTSYREYDILGRQESLDPLWRELLLAYPGRFLLGSDTWVNAQWARYAEIMESNRLWLAMLPRNVAEKIAYQNAEKLFGRPVEKSLMGQR